MKYITVTLSILALFLFSMRSLAQTSHSNQLQGVVNQIVQPAMASSGTPGIAVAIHFNGQDYFFNYGLANAEQNQPVTNQTIFELASISKVFTSTLLAVSVKQGLINLNDPIVKYLPQLKNTSGLVIDQVKIINLATHTASFPHDYGAFGVDTSDFTVFSSGLASWHPAVPVGTQYAYSNVGFGLLGKILEVANGQSYSNLLQQDIATPLGLQNTFIFVPTTQLSQQAQGYKVGGLPAPHYQPGLFYGGGAVRSSSADMLRFLNANLGIATSVSPQLLSAMQLAQQPYFTVKPTFAMGLGWQRVFRFGNLFITKNGMNIGFSSFIGFSPLHQYAVVVLANKRDANATRIGNQILNQLSTL